MRRHLSTILITSVLTIPFACGQSDKSEFKSLAPSVQELVNGFCDVAFRCCTPGEVAYLIAPYLNKDSCKDRLNQETELEPSALFKLIELGGLRMRIPNLGALDRAAREHRGHIDAEAVKACKTYLANLPCNQVPENAEGCQPIPPEPDQTPCDPRKLFIGEIPSGDECTSEIGSLECEPGLVCRTSYEFGVKGQCVRPGAEGEPCVPDDTPFPVVDPDFEDPECERGLFCSRLDGTCQHLRKEGETCVYSDRENLNPSSETLVLPCASNLDCDPVTDTCVAHCQQGAACSSDDDCDTEQQDLHCIVGRCDKKRAEGLPCAYDEDCVEGLRCAQDKTQTDMVSYICQQKFAVGETCTAHEECATGFCDLDTFTCADTVAVGGLCPSGQDQQCGDGDCVTDPTTCTMDSECTGSNKCEIDPISGNGLCAYYCVARKNDGALCDADLECVSKNCIVGFCRTLPLSLGQTCTNDDQCDSGFCGLETERVCTDLPLHLSDACAYDDQCESKVCDQTGDTPVCATGLDEGEACGGFDDAPCNPFKFFCDIELDRPVCVPLHEAGESCTDSNHSYQCRGSCTLTLGRYICDATPAPDAVVCDGK